MLPPASPMMVQTWPSTPGALRMVARQPGAGDGVALGLGRPLQVAPDAPRGPRTRPGCSQSMVWTVRPWPRLEDADDAVARHRRAAVAEVDADAGASGRRRARRAARPCRPRCGCGAAAASRSAAFRPGNTVSSTWAGVDAAAADGVEQLVLGGDGEAVQRRAQRDVLRAPCRRASKAWSTVARPRLLELLPLGLADVAADGRAGAAGDGQRAPVRRHDRLGAADDLDHVAVLQRRAQRLELAVDLHARRRCRRRRCGRRRRSPAAWPRAAG